MTDLATLQIRIQSLEAEVADRRLRNLSDSGRRAESATDGLMKKFAGFASVAAIATAAMAGLSKTLEVQREFDILNASLITATGSAENASIAFDALTQFAANTPYDLAQATKGFTQLVNLGLTPSERAMTSYGNTASAMGKSLDQMIEAVADAATGEFERLKEFGIKAAKQGDDIALTFRGITTTVGNNAAEIEDYLIALGEVEFAGAMQERMDSLDGAISNFGDTWDGLWRTISDQGVGELLESGVRLATDALEGLNDFMASGEMQHYISAIGTLFTGFGDDVSATINWVTSLFEGESSGWVNTASAAVKYMIEAFMWLPQNLRTVVRLMAVELGAIVDYGKAFGQGLVDVMVAKFKELYGKAKAYATAIADAFNPFSSGYNLAANLKSLEAVTANTFARVTGNVNAVTEARRASIGAVMDERNATVASFNAQIEAAKKARIAFAETKGAKDALGGDVLGQFKTGGSSNGAGDSEAASKKAEAASKKAAAAADKQRKATERAAAAQEKASKRAAERAEKEAQKAAEREEKASQRAIDNDIEAFNSMLENLRTEEEVLVDAYNTKIGLLNRHIDKTHWAYEEVYNRITKIYNEDTQDLIKKRTADIDSLVDSLRTEEEKLERSYQKRIQIVKDNTDEESQERADLLKRLEYQNTQQNHELALARSADIDNLVESLKTEEELVADSYQKRLAVILENTEHGTKEKNDLIRRLDADFAASVLEGVAEDESYAYKLGQVEEFYTKRMQLILDNTQITEDLRTELETKLAEERTERLKEIEQSRWDEMLADSQTGFDGLVSLTKSFAGEQSGVYKVMFAASKAFAIADSIMKIQQGIAAASALPFPANLGAIASTVAATAGIVSTIMSTKMELAGAYDKGGMIPSGKIGLVGEYGPELIKGPAIITGRERSADLMGKQSVQNPVTINIINKVSGTEVTANESIGAEGRIVDIVVDKARKEIAKDIREGGGLVSRSIENTYGVKRGAA